MKTFDIAGRVALVTGASSGLGEHFARLLASEGAVVILAEVEGKIILIEQSRVPLGGLVPDVT